MAYAFVDNQHLTDIANSIRNKTGSQATMKVSEMSSNIANIENSDNTDFIKVVEGEATSITLPNGATRIKKFLFYQDRTLRTVNIPNSVKIIENSSFSNSRITSLNLPNSIENIQSDAFYYCGQLTIVTFEGTPTSIDSSAFSSCSQLTTINVPWSEGDVANAPWGAINATINYNYVG